MKNIFLSTLVSLAIFNISASADTLSLVSGITTNGVNDSEIHMLTGPMDGFLTNDMSSPDTFSAASNGPFAYVVTPNSAWAQVDNAQWISSDPNGGNGGSFTALYALSVDLPAVTSASLDVQFSADQQLGSTADDGIFINGTALPGSGGGNYSTVLTFDDPDVSSLLHPGENTLYLYNVNFGGPSGITFDATLDYTPAPEPATGALCGLSALCGCRLLRRAAARK
jgi:hypothetical protein